MATALEGGRSAEVFPLIHLPFVGDLNRIHFCREGLRQQQRLRHASMRVIVANALGIVQSIALHDYFCLLLHRKLLATFDNNELADQRRSTI
jgi:hypothetical protein